MKVLDLFSGIGGFSLALERAGMETVAFCEIDPYCQKVLKKHWPDVPIYDDVRNLNYDGRIDLISGGYPCQPFSLAGKREGEEDDRHLWPSMFSLIKKHRPNWVIGENVAGHISMGLDTVLADMGNEGYTSRVFILPACAVNAPHRRDRCWIIGYANGKRCDEQQSATKSEKEKRVASFANSQQENVARPNGIGQQRQGRAKQSIDTKTQEDWKEYRIVNAFRGFTQSPVRGRNDGVSRKLDRSRLKALGNAVVPQIPEMIGRAIMEIENEPH